MALRMFGFVMFGQMKAKLCNTHEWCEGECQEPHVVLKPAVPAPADVRTAFVPGPDLENTEGRGEIDASSETYQYQPLSSDRPMIRLLRIKPAELRASVVDCDLVEADFDSELKYGALSYHWGPPEFDRQIICNGKILNITRTLHGALRRYRQDRQRRQEFLWVDAICINQQDKAELNSQLLLMRQIYQNARYTHIDLGDIQPEWYAGFDLLHRLALSYDLSKDRSDLKPSNFVREYGLPPADHISWSCYFYPLSSPWFRRTWIIQETVLSKAKVVMLGRFTFMWGFFRQSMDVIGMHSLQTSPYLSSVKDRLQGFLNYTLIDTIGIELEHTSPTLLQVMTRTRNFLVSDLRDKVIAVLGLFGDRTAKFEPDYTLATEKVYTRFAEYLIELGEGIDMLSYAGTGRRNDVSAMPSWVPDWSAQSLDLGVKVIATIRQTRFSASGSTKAAIRSTGDSIELDTMAVGGVLVDCITTLSDKLWPSNSLLPRVIDNSRGLMIAFVVPPTFLEWHDATRAISDQRLSSSGYYCYADPIEAFARTLLMNDLYTGSNSVTGMPAILEPVRAYNAAIAQIRVDGRPQEGAMENEADTCRFQMNTVCGGRKFGITEKGYFGLVPGNAEVGDKIFIPLGSSVPFVIREKEGQESTFELVGDAYVHGIMDGEEVEKEDVRVEEILLC